MAKDVRAHGITEMLMSAYEIDRYDARDWYNELSDKEVDRIFRLVGSWERQTAERAHALLDPIIGDRPSRTAIRKARLAGLSATEADEAIKRWRHKQGRGRKPDPKRSSANDK